MSAIDSLEQAAQVGMSVAYHASQRPDDLAIISEFGDRTFAELNANANRLARVLRAHGLLTGDSIAVVTHNRPEFIEALFAAARTGLRFTPINFHLTGEEIGYIVSNCEAKAFIGDADLSPAPEQALAQAPNATLRLHVGGELAGFDSYSTAIAGIDGSDIDEPAMGNRMLYTSGTTGRPKGVFKRDIVPEVPQGPGTLPNYKPGEDRQILTGPAYHAAPLLIDILQPLVTGVGVVMMHKWDPERTLALIERHKVTHGHMVATMFHRLLQLPEEVRARYDLSSMKLIVHGAAPCPVHVKQSMIDWFGPILWEYYAATEGGGGFIVGSEEWLTKPGTVGRPGPEFDNKILDDEGNEVATGEVGTIYMRAPDVGRFEYYKDSEKTDSSYRGDYFTLGDMGYFDEDGYLFLTGRTAELIISGGVNIYPIEVDNELLKHPAVLDACTFGAPNDEWGEEVRAIVALREGHTPGDALAQELTGWLRERLAGFKCPRVIEFVGSVPRSAAGKVQRKEVRARYWEDQ